MFKPLVSLLLLLILLGACKKEVSEKPIPGIESVPMNLVQLADLKEFEVLSQNWTIAGKVFSDYQKEQDLETEPGIGILVNQTTGESDMNLISTWDHADLELELEFMMPKGSNSGVYLMGRYEIQLFDSWNVEQAQYSDCGGIYQRWDDQASEGSQGYEGHPPRINASKAPGLWQQLYIKFTAPKFDTSGKKISNARFDKVVLNGVEIHRNVSLTGPTRASVDSNEVDRAPLMLQGDHGNVAFRSIRYKRFFEEQVTLKNLEYQYYHIQPSKNIPDFDSLQLLTEGKVDSFDIEKVAERDDNFGIRFNGTVTTPIAGPYVFHTVSDDGSMLYVDGQLVVSNDDDHRTTQNSGLINLSKGDHRIVVDYYNNTWSKRLAVLYEGPEIPYQPLYSNYTVNEPTPVEPIPVEPMTEPELLRGFINYKGEKKTHTISVGYPSGLSYTHDLPSGSLLKVWKGGFADAAKMWRNRGISQLIEPITMSVDVGEAAIVAILENESDEYPLNSQPELKSKGFELDKSGIPTFKYSLKEADIENTYTMGAEGERLIRTIKIEPGSVSDLYHKVVGAEYIQLLDNGLYSVGGQYYLELLSDDSDVFIRSSEIFSELLIPVDAQTTIKYSLLW